MRKPNTVSIGVEEPSSCSLPQIEEHRIALDYMLCGYTIEEWAKGNIHDIPFANKSFARNEINAL